MKCARYNDYLLHIYSSTYSIVSKIYLSMLPHIVCLQNQDLFQESNLTGQNFFFCAMTLLQVVMHTKVCSLNETQYCMLNSDVCSYDIFVPNVCVTGGGRSGCVVTVADAGTGDVSCGVMLKEEADGYRENVV